MKEISSAVSPTIAKVGLRLLVRSISSNLPIVLPFAVPHNGGLFTYVVIVRTPSTGLSHTSMSVFSLHIRSAVISNTSHDNIGERESKLS